MANKAQKFRLGVFLITGFSLIIITIIIIAGSNLSQKRDNYYINFLNESVGGLDVGSKVNYQGIGVGRVEDITISPEDVTSIIVAISIKGGTPIKSDAKASLSPVGITGLNAIEIKGGTNESKLLPPESYIEVEKSLFGTITNKAVSITEQLDELIKSLNKLADQGNIDNIASIIGNLDDILTENRSTLEGTMTNLELISGDVASFTHVLESKLDTLVSSATQSIVAVNKILNNDSINKIITNLDTISTDLAGADLDVLIASVNSSVLRLESMMSTVDNTVSRSRRDIIDILESAREAMENLNEFSKQINDNPSAIIRGNN
jgi:phospholipid/cholesterol/gamma-HCH transport system substrate-binding protein